MAKRIAVIEYGMGNVDSVARSVELCGGRPTLTGDPAVLQDADGIILPGVGAFADAMAELERRSLTRVIQRLVLEEGMPFLGICLGMQLMATRGEEGGATTGLGLIPGEVIRLAPNDPTCRVPHVGWNDVWPEHGAPLFAGIPPGTDFYFVHSYQFRCNDAADVAARATHGTTFVAAVGRGCCFGTQFHPEKSLTAGRRLLANFLALC